MPGVVSRSGGRRSRRAMAEMNMVPFIDVMLVLLIIFMATAPMISTGIVDLPTVGKAAQRPSSVVEVIVGADEKLRLRLDGADPKTTSLRALAADVQALQAGNAQVPVVISAEKTVKYEAVVRAMDALQKSGVQRVGLTVKQGG
ncbi:MAG: biopolymer transporter ExbD [Pseudomonadota bacterium]